MGLGARLALVFAAVSAVTAILVGAASFITTDRQVLAEIDNFLIERVEEITGGQREQRGGRGGDDDDDDDAEDLVEELQDVFSPDSEVQFLDRDGTVISTSGSGLTLPVDDTDLEIADRDVESVLRTVVIDEAEFRLITAHIPDTGAVQIARSLDESAGLIGVLQTRLLIIALSLGLAAGVLGWFFAQRTTQPLRELTNAVDEVAETQDFSTPVPQSGSDEVGRLAGGFNRMLEALQVSQSQQRQLVQDAAHELRTPLTSVMMNVDWLIRAPDMEENARVETLGGVRSELNELNNVIAEIIELATGSYTEAEFARTDLVEVVEAAVEQFVGRTDRDVAVEATSTAVMGDSGALHRAVTNLLSNADKYSPAGQQILVEVGAGAVHVGDTGPGIPEADRDLVLARFHRRDNDRSKPGSGLGLSIVSSIVEHHGGTVEVGESTLGGARVGFTLPEL